MVQTTQAPCRSPSRSGRLCQVAAAAGESMRGRWHSARSADVLDLNRAERRRHEPRDRSRQCPGPQSCCCLACPQGGLLQVRSVCPVQPGARSVLPGCPAVPGPQVGAEGTGPQSRAGQATPTRPGCPVLTNLISEAPGKPGHQLAGVLRGQLRVLRSQSGGLRAALAAFSGVIAPDSGSLLLRMAVLRDLGRGRASVPPRSQLP